MSQKLRRFFMVFLISIATFGLLMGSTYAYNSLALTKPLEDKVTKIPSIGAFRYERMKTEEKIIVEFTEPSKLRSSFYQLLDQIQLTNQSNITVEISNKANEKLSSFLQEARLPIHEAISTGEYTALPAKLTQLAAKSQLEFNLELDNDFIFLTVVDGTVNAHLVVKSSDLNLKVITTMGGEYL